MTAGTCQPYTDFVKCLIVALLPDLQDVVAGVEGQLCVEDGAADAEGLQEQAQAEALVDGVDKQQHLLAHQAQPQQHHRLQQLAPPASTVALCQLCHAPQPSAMAS